MLEYVTLENNHLKVEIDHIGAELKSVFNKNTQTEYLWQGDPNFWKRQAPILFPFVGMLKNDSFIYKKQDHTMYKHGFARDVYFELLEKSAEYSSFILKSSEMTKLIFPFDFELVLYYTLSENKLTAGASIKNISSSQVLFCSLGFHPAFNIPLTSDTLFNDYFLTFNKDKSADAYQLENGLITDVTHTAFTDGLLPLNYQLFEKDALVFKKLQSDEITIKSNKTDRGLKFNFENFPYFGIWTIPNAPYLCLEPWHGIADNVHHDGNIETKEGILSIPERKSFSCQYEVKCF